MRDLLGYRHVIAVGVAWVILLLGPGSYPTMAQVATGAITGIVSDEGGGALPGATVTAANLATGQTRTAVTNERGRYQLTALQPGLYSVTAELQSFATVVRQQVTVNVGSTLDIDLIMSIAALEETVRVTGEAPLLQSKKTDVSNVITEQHLESLPSKERAFLDYALLTPASVESVARSQGTGVVIGGARSKESMLLVDAFYGGDESFSTPKMRHSQDAIQEFQVVSFGGSAEHGRAIGGIINAVTKSGSNQFSGSTYGFFRDTSLNAQDFGEKRRGSPKTEIDRQQWGGTLGGPIKHDKSFFFGAFERTDENSPFDNLIKPEHAAVIGLPPDDVGSVTRFFDNTFGMAKWDHNISSANQLLVSFSAGKWIDLRGSGRVQPLQTRSRHFAPRPTDYSFWGKWLNIAANGRKLHEMKVSYAPRYYWLFGFPKGGPPLVPDGEINQTHPQSNTTPPSVNISSVALFGSVSLNNEMTAYPVQAIYTSTIFAENHSLKFGADYMYAHTDYSLYSPLKGTYSFPSLEAFLQGRYSTYTQAFGDPSNNRTHQYISAFIQDSWQAGERLTMNYGLRYDLELNPQHKQSGTPFGNDYNNFGPRFALSYDLTGKGTTFLKLTSGVYYDRLFQNLTTFFSSLKDAGAITSATWRPTNPGAPVYPNVFAEAPANMPLGLVNAWIMPEKVNIPTNAQFVGTVERALSQNLAISASVVYTRSWYKEHMWDTNLQWDEASLRWVRPDPRYQRVDQYVFDGPSEYVGGIVDLNGRGTKTGFNANLTVSRADEVTLGRPNDQRAGILGDWGRGPDNPTVRAVMSGWYDITPHIQLSGSFRTRSGMPVDPRAAGRDLTGEGIFGDRTPTFEPFSFVGPTSMSTVDARLTWTVPVGAGRKKLHFYLESFNLLNRENIRSVLDDYGPDPSTPGPRWMEPATWFPPRELQVGARFRF